MASSYTYISISVVYLFYIYITFPVYPHISPSPTWRRRALHFFLGAARGACTATGALSLATLTLGVAPYVRRRAPLEWRAREALEEDLQQICALDGREALSFERLWASACELKLPPLSFQATNRSRADVITRVITS